VAVEEAEAPVWRLGRWTCRGTGVKESGGGGAVGPQSAAGTVVEVSWLNGGGGHGDLDDRAREEGHEWRWDRACGFSLVLLVSLAHPQLM
jgi:hypothetical protein